MTEAIETIADLSPLAAIVIIAGIASMAITQAAKQPTMSKAMVQRIAVGVSIVLGTLAYIVSGVASIFPPTVVQVVSSGVVVIAGVAIASRAAYAVLGHAIPDGGKDDAGISVQHSEVDVEAPRRFADSEARRRVDALRDDA